MLVHIWKSMWEKLTHNSIDKWRVYIYVLPRKFCDDCYKALKGVAEVKRMARSGWKDRRENVPQFASNSEATAIVRQPGFSFSADAAEFKPAVASRTIVAR